jgi:regulator of sirC expression with transglutaminase-like and TPR domain
LLENKQIAALLHLIDDPDEEVYDAVTTKIVSLGKEVIPALENFWESITDPDVQERIEMLIHKLQITDLTADLTKWKHDGMDLLSGAMLVSKFAYPDLEVNTVLKEIEKLRRNTWLEMNSYLTPIEQIHVINSILYNFSKQMGVPLDYENADVFLLNKVLETKRGNSFGNGILYLILCTLLDVPVKAIAIPKQFVLGYFDLQYDLLNPAGHSSEKIKFYIDPSNGQMYSHKDVENYFKKLSVPPVSSYFRPMDNKRIIQYLLEELAKCYDNDAQRYKADEINGFINLLNE